MSRGRSYDAESVHRDRRAVVALAAVGVAVYSGALFVAGTSTRLDAAAARSATQATTRLPHVVIRPSKGVDSELDRRTAVQIAADLQKRRPAAARLRRVTVWLEAESADQFPLIVVRLEGASSVRTVEVTLSPGGYQIARVRG